jgi:hypothetical protein
VLTEKFEFWAFVTKNRSESIKQQILRQRLDKK